MKEIISSQDSAISQIRRSLDSGFRAVDRVAFALDIEVEGPAIRLPITAMGKGAKFGETITDSSRLFASTREPVGVRIVKDVAIDIWDTWFTVEDDNTDEKSRDKSLDENVQKALSEIHAKQALIRSTIFERRYGWGLIVLGYDDDAESLADPLPDVGDGKGRTGLSIVMVEPYPKTKVEKTDLVTVEDVNSGDEPMDMLGYPKYYYVNRGGGVSTGTKIHHSRVILDSVRLDEHKWQGVSVLDGIYDDITGFRNMRWGMYQTIYRYGSGFPVITLKEATEKDVERYYESGKFADLCARTYLVKDDKEEFEFAGTQMTALNPNPYYEMGMESLSIGTRIPKAVFRGAQAGAVVGSEVNLREYAQFISGEQSLKEKVLRMLIQRLIETGQIETAAESYNVVWQSPFELDEKTKALIEVAKSTALKNLEDMLTLDELRAKMDPPLPELPGGLGKLVYGLEKIRLRMMTGAGDVAASAPELEEKQLHSGFKDIWKKVELGTLDKPEAMSLAGVLIGQYTDMVQQAALSRLETVTGKSIGVASPEAQTLRQEQINGYMDYFEKILDDIIGGLE